MIQKLFVSFVFAVVRAYPWGKWYSFCRNKIVYHNLISRSYKKRKKEHLIILVERNSQMIWVIRKYRTVASFRDIAFEKKEKKREKEKQKKKKKERKKKDKKRKREKDDVERKKRTRKKNCLDRKTRSISISLIAQRV